MGADTPRKGQGSASLKGQDDTASVVEPEALREHFVDLVRGEKAVLEVGPFCNPALVGDNIRYFDVMDRLALQRRASEIGFAYREAPDIDYVSASGDLAVVNDRFEAVFSAHCIEHQPDLIYHLRNVSRILPEGGRYYLIVPDRRFCFDYTIPETTIAEVIQAYLQAHRLHSFTNVIRHLALTTHNDPVRHWQGDHFDPGHEERIAVRVGQAMGSFSHAAGVYIDVHAWQFTSESFGRLILNLQKLGYTDFVAEKVYPTPHGRFEFTAILRKSGGGLGTGIADSRSLPSS